MINNNDHNIVNNETNIDDEFCIEGSKKEKKLFDGIDGTISKLTQFTLKSPQEKDESSLLIEASILQKLKK